MVGFRVSTVTETEKETDLTPFDQIATFLQLAPFASLKKTTKKTLHTLVTVSLLKP